MATEQVLNWIGGTVTPHNQAPLKLSRNIDSFESDFASGYLFGEILSQYGLGAPLSSFSKKNNKEAKVHNFFMVEACLRQLKVVFDAKLMHQIMNEERGASLRLLYQIKLAVDRHFGENKASVTGLRPGVIDKKVKMVSELATKLPHIGKKEYGIEGPSIAPGKNFRVVEDKLLKFELAHKELKERARKGDLEEKNMLQSMQQDKRQEAMKKLRENQDFMKSWEKKGREDWRKNRSTRAHEIQRALDFDDREVRVYRDRLERELTFNAGDMHDGIDAFHENMQKLGIEQNISIAEAMRRQEEKAGIPPGQIQNFSYAATMNKIKETKNNNEFAGKERERRNRKMLVDQRAIQEQLDIKKHEESMIQRLLEKQSTEQKVAMDIDRKRKCQQLVLRNRKKKQDDQAMVKLKLNEYLDRKMRKDAEQQEGQRHIEHQNTQTQYRDQRRAEKFKKRGLNIEIASEIIDLIMDVAEVATDQMEEAEALAAQRREAGEEEDSDEAEERRLIQKPTWRHWMDIFTDGKKVSEQNLVIEEDDPAQQNRGQGLDSMSQLLSTSGTSTVSPYKLMTEIRGESIFTELLQYVCQTGPLNLRLVATDKWSCFRDVLGGTRLAPGATSGQSNTSTPRQLSERSLDSAEYLNSIYLPKNVELGRFINRMYNGPNSGALLAGSSSMEDAFVSPGATALAQTGRSATGQAISEENQAHGAVQDGGNVTVGSHAIERRGQDAITVLNQNLETNMFKPDFPTYHSLKLALLGGSFAGKRTIAACMKQKMGESITMFNMSEILREALAYVDPNAQKEEVVDPKAKGKGKGAPEAPVDIFAGKDTVRYKEVANALFKQVQLTTGNENGLPEKNVDLVQLVSDDDLLIQLFTQKLKLTYPAQGTSAEEREATLRNRMAKETELLEQLEEAKQNEGTEVDPKGKGKPKAVKSAQEVQEELNALMSFEKKGWILLDFPRNLSQAKLLEKAFTGFQSISDKPKASAFESFEVWSKFTDPDGSALEAYEGEIEAQPSLFDCVVLLDASKDECLRRAKNRKMDPTTQTVYHAEDSPAPEDPKLVERLVDYFGEYASAEDMVEKLSSAHDRFDSYQPVLKEFYGTFGKFDKIEKQGFETLNCTKVQEGNTRDAVQEQTVKLMDKIFAFKQIDEDRVFADFKLKVKNDEERARLEAEAAEKGATDDISGGPSADKSARDGNKPASQTGEPKQSIESNLPVDKSIKGNTPMANHLGLAEQQLSKTSIHSKMSMSQSGVGGATGVSRSRKKNRVEYTKSYITKLWEDMEVNYLKDGVMSLSDIKRQRLSVTDNLNNCQRQFIEFLERPCEKQDKVNEFVQSFNQFSGQYPDLRKDDQTKDELSSRLERLANALWDITESRKEQSLERIADMSKSGWSNQEMRQVVRNMASLVEIEIKKISTVYQIVMQHESPIELDAEIFAKKQLERGIQPYDEQKGTSPALEQVFSNLLSKVNELIYKNTSVLPVINEEQGIILRNEKNVLTYRLAQIYSWALVILEEIHVNSRQVYDRLDDWIVDAVAQENFITQDVVNFIKEAISSEVMFIDDFQAQMQPIELFSKLEVIQYRSDETPLYMRNVIMPNEQVETTRFTVPQLRNLFKEMRQNAGGLGHGGIVETNSFTNMMVLAVRHGRVPLCWRYYNFDRIMQLIRKFEVTPLKTPRAVNQQLSFLAQTQTAASSQCWVDWKRALLAFALVRTDVPNDQVILQLQEQLGGADASVSKARFVKATFWFDAVEGQPEAALYTQWLTAKRAQMQEEEYDSELDDSEVAAELAGKVDTERLSDLKALIFDLYRAPTGEEKLNVADLVSALRGYRSASVSTFDQYLFHD